MPTIKKATKIRREEEKLLQIFAGLDDDTLIAVQGMIHNVAWMGVSLDEIRAQIDETGEYVEVYTNGATQQGMKQSCLIQTYNNLIKNYNSSVKILLAQIPKDAPQGGKDALAGFLLKN